MATRAFPVLTETPSHPLPRPNRPEGTIYGRLGRGSGWFSHNLKEPRVLTLGSVDCGFRLRDAGFIQVYFGYDGDAAGFLGGVEAGVRSLN